MARKPIIVGNWKMNGTVEETLKLITELHHKLESPEVDVVVAPPFTSLYSAYVMLQEMPTIKLAAQNMHWEAEGAYTGEISGVFLKEIACDYVIIGHSERRQYFAETDEAVCKKVASAVAQELIPILCIGETRDQRASGKTENVLESQLKKALSAIPMSEAKNIVVAYEPVWAIGSGETPTEKEIESAAYFIRNYLGRLYDAPTANTMRILYGGSVNSENSGIFLRIPNIDGLLVGGASLFPEKFLKIIESRHSSS
ncbi:MAG: triose-phosphate isomerase [Deltaproteobacteria bacterium]|nr:MAG: triose-phosphate isomerase [Deltaproteobacteria bacterium]